MSDFWGGVLCMLTSFGYVRSGIDLFSLKSLLPWKRKYIKTMSLFAMWNTIQKKKQKNYSQQTNKPKTQNQKPKHCTKHLAHMPLYRKIYLPLVSYESSLRTTGICGHSFKTVLWWENLLLSVLTLWCFHSTK